VVKGVGTVTIPNVSITLTPVNPPIEIPANGGSFNFNVSITNGESSTQAFDGWIMQQVPGGGTQGPMLGPVNLTLSAGVTLNRTRTQSVPGSAAPGTYNYIGYVGSYSSVKWDSSFFTYTKLTAGDGPVVDNWDNYGDSFDEYRMPTAWAETPTYYSLGQNYPNPFNPTTTFEFKLPQASQVRLAVFDLSGRLISTVVDGFRNAGVHKVTFDGSGLASGIYVYRLTAADYTASGKMMLLK